MVAKQFLEEERVYGFFRGIFPVVVDSVEEHEVEKFLLLEGVWLRLRCELEGFPNAVLDHFFFCLF